MLARMGQGPCKQHPKVQEKSHQQLPHHYLLLPLLAIR